MKKFFFLGLLSFFLVFYWSGLSLASQSSSSAETTTTVVAGASGGDATALNKTVVAPNISPNISPTNQVGVQVNPGQTVSPQQGQKQRLSIDDHSKTEIRNINRQFLPLGAVPTTGTMQMFVPPREFGTIPNFEGVYLGIWRRASDRPSTRKELMVSKDRPLKLHRYIYNLSPTQKVLVIVGKEPLRGASPVGEVDGMAYYKEDSRSLQMFAIDRMANWGANVVLVVINGAWFESWSKGSNKGVAGGGSQLATNLEKIVFGERLEYSLQKSKGGVVSYPVVQTIGYRMKEEAWKKLISPPPSPPSTPAHTTTKNHDGKKWETISHSH